MMSDFRTAFIRELDNQGLSVSDITGVDHPSYKTKDAFIDGLNALYDHRRGLGFMEFQPRVSDVYLPFALYFGNSVLLLYRLAGDRDALVSVFIPDPNKEE